MIPWVRFLSAVLFCLLAPVSVAYSLEPRDPHADLIFVRGQIVTVDEQFSIYNGKVIEAPVRQGAKSEEYLDI